MASSTPQVSSRARSERAPSKLELGLRVLPFGLALYPLLGAAAGRSEVRTVLGRYSVFLAAMLVACSAILAFGLWSLRRGWLRREQLALIGLALSSYLLPGSNQVQALWGIGLVLPLLRAAAAVALCAVEVRKARTQHGKAGAFLSAGILLVLLSIADIGIAIATRSRPVHAQASESGFRVAYDLHALADDGVVLIGDSFVWGQGVPVHARFGDQLQAAYQKAGTPRPVYSLGLIGAGLTAYLHALEQIPEHKRTGRIVLSYYVNDIPPRAQLAGRIRDLFIALGVGAPTLRVVGDVVGKTMTPTLERYNKGIVADYDERDPSFAARFAVLEADVAKFHQLASARSAKPPVLLILPLMVDFARYPLTDAHRRVRELGERLGFQVVDVLPAFREQLGDGRKHLVAANDNHFDAASHAIVAEALHDALERR